MDTDPTIAQRWRDRRATYRARGDAFHPSEFGVELLTGDRAARAFVEAHHYSGSYVAARCRVGLYRSRPGWYTPELVGVAVFSVPMSQAVIPKWSGVAAWLRRALPTFARVRHPGNHAYLWHLDGTAPPASLPYPKRAMETTHD